MSRFVLPERIRLPSNVFWRFRQRIAICLRDKLDSSSFDAGMRRGFASLFLIAMLGACSDAVVDYSGTYAANGVRLRLRKDGDGYTGSLKLGDKTHVVEASLANNEMLGDYFIGTERYGFTACRDGDTIRFESGKYKYDLKRTTDAGAPPN